MAAANAARAAETAGVVEVVGSLIESLNPSEGGQDWVFSDLSTLSLDDPARIVIEEVTKQFGYNSSGNDILQTGVALISYVALTEFAQHALSIGSGFVTFNFQGMIRIKLLGSIS